VAAAVSAALVAPVVVQEAQPLVPADPHSLREPAAPLLALLLVLVAPVLAGLLVLARLVVVVAHLVVEPEALLHLRSRQSFSAATVRSTRSPPPTY
jgi:hypothetical protein